MCAGEISNEEERGGGGGDEEVKERKTVMCLFILITGGKWKKNIYFLPFIIIDRIHVQTKHKHTHSHSSFIVLRRWTNIATFDQQTATSVVRCTAIFTFTIQFESKRRRHIRVVNCTAVSELKFCNVFILAKRSCYTVFNYFIIQMKLKRWLLAALSAVNHRKKKHLCRESRSSNETFVPSAEP